MSQDTDVQVAADTFLYTPLNVGLFFALMTVVEGGHWKVRAKANLHMHRFSDKLAELSSFWP